MAQVTDRTVGANPTGFDMRTELNNIIGALESDNSGSSEPLNTVAYMKWLDTSNATYYYYKERNHDNTAWVTLFRYTVATKIMEVVSNGVILNDVVVHKTGDETIAGTKVFTNRPFFLSPNVGTSGAVGLFDASGNPDAVYIQALNNERNAQYGFLKFNKNGTITPSGDIVGNITGNAGTVTNGVYTTNFTGINQSLGESGYQKLPGGLIIQWGRTGNISSGDVINLPISFPNGGLIAVSNHPGASLFLKNINIFGKSQILIFHNYGAPVFVNYIAIGY